MIIAIVGEKRCGKDTAYALLKELLGDNWERIGLADEIKAITSDVLKIPLADLEILKNKETPILGNGITARHVLQNLGQRLKLNFGKELWCDLAHNKMVKGRNYVITDIRYPFELEYFKMCEEVISIRVVRDTGLEKDTHSSETSSKDIPVDYTVDNNGTKNDLMGKLTDVANSLTGKKECNS